MIGNASANFARDLANPDFNIFLISQSSPLDPIIPPVSRTVIFFLVFQIQETVCFINLPLSQYIPEL